MKKIWYILPVILILAVLALILLFSRSSDKFGKNHPIPEGLQFSLPLDSLSTSEVDTLDSKSWLVLWNDIQGGIYKYDFYYSPLPAGEIFLKCYEATENIPLSVKEIEERSKVQIDSTASFTQLVNKQQFSIYEGDWEDYYAARIEVWFKDAATGQEKKLLEKVYRVEGWTR